MPAIITGLVLAEGLMAAVLSDTLSLTAPRSTAAELRFCTKFVVLATKCS
jgi:hypothetical protein